MMIPSCSRSVNASSAERSLLLGVLSKHLNVLDARDNDSRTLRHKNFLWDQVTQNFNALSALPRSRHQIQNLYKNMKAKAKKYHQRIREANMNDSPHMYPEPDTISELLLQMLAGEHEQRMMQIKQTALNISSELTVNVSPDEVVTDEMSPQENTTSEKSSESNDYHVSIKNESSFAEDPPVEALLNSDENQSRSESKSPDDNSFFNNFPSTSIERMAPPAEGATVEDPSSALDKEDVSEKAEALSSTQIIPPSSSPRLPLTTNSSENDFNNSNQSPKQGYKRPRLSSQASFGDLAKGFNSLYRNGPQAPFNRDLFNDSIHNLRFNDSHMPVLPGINKQCCCPGLHSELVALAKEEHNIRMKAAEEERKYKGEQHEEKMKLLKLEQELCQRKIKLTERNFSSNEKQNVHNNTVNNQPLTMGLNHWGESLYNSNNSMNQMNMNLGSDSNLAPKPMNHPTYQNDYKMQHQSNI
ncbi:hypothetical protein Avbf_04611 [Armadillidium vulgare]|nr:hypothetical protein Avbf_04611 [Armadillidium vulgare]